MSGDGEAYCASTWEAIPIRVTRSGAARIRPTAKPRRPA